VAGRTFIVRISEAPRRVVIEDVRTQRRSVPRDLDAIGSHIAAFMSEAEAGHAAGGREGPNNSNPAVPREDSVSPPS
jgi:hypothetical protein